MKNSFFFNIKTSTIDQTIMETEQFVFFYGHHPNSLGIHVFSQWYSVSFVEYFDKETKIKYSNMEQYMMAHKALLFGDSKYYKKIMSTTDPYLIKKYGRLIRDFDEKIWNQYKFDIIVNGNKLKFKQNPKLLKRLLETKNKILVEASPFDKIYGCGLNTKTALKTDQSQWPGTNLLGKALMEVRAFYL